ncbi:3156_t:CDS:2 [Cetraspora pellucida]|uniref:3156_t:CDS:1 n=1 Tax=Cetraspora pellucida TaxID=1433469 RepID=A0A9N9DXN4_9GLOM|nr:3156_t:CDS:2 [Cetraspora pellucida]
MIKHSHNYNQEFLNEINPKTNKHPAHIYTSKFINTQEIVDELALVSIPVDAEVPDDC